MAKYGGGKSGKSPINSTEYCFPRPNEGSKPKSDVSSAFAQKKGQSYDDSSPLTATNDLSDTPTKSTPDSWVKGGSGSGKFDSPDDRKKHSYGK